jgi:hypothetical protein
MSDTGRGFPEQPGAQWRALKGRWYDSGSRDSVWPTQPDVGSHMPKHFTPVALRAVDKARMALADRRAIALAPIINELRSAGITSRKRIADALNERGVPTARGRGHWYPMQVGRLLRRLTW